MKRGITLLEVLITIAIISILSSIVIIYGFGYIEKANRSADEQCLVIYNQLLKDYSTTVSKPTSVKEVKKVLNIDDKVEPIIAKQKGKLFIWNKTINRIELIDENAFSNTNAKYNVDYILREYFITYRNISYYLLNEEFMKPVFDLKISDSSIDHNYNAGSIAYEIINAYLKNIGFSDGTSNYRYYSLGQAYTTETTIPENIHILDEVKEINNSLFKRKPIIKSVRIANTITTINQEQFRSCSNLESVIIDEDSKLKTIEKNAFAMCNKLKQISLPDSLESINEYAFSSCFGIEEIFIPKNVQTIAPFAFNACKNIKKVEVDIENEHFKSIDNVLYNYDLTELYYYSPQKKNKIFNIPSSVTTIRSAAFDIASFLQEVTMDDSVVNIGQLFMNQCTSLRKIQMSNKIKNLGSSAFYLCSSLQEVNIPDSLSTIEDNSFYQCINLTYLFIPSTLTTIKSDVFSYCINLEVYSSLSSAPATWFGTWNTWIKGYYWNQVKR